jgi:hypothetical protein
MNRFKSEEVNPRRTVRNPALIGGPTSSVGASLRALVSHFYLESGDREICKNVFPHSTAMGVKLLVWRLTV